MRRRRLAAFLATSGFLAISGSGCAQPGAPTKPAPPAPVVPSPSLDCASLSPCPDAPCGEGQGCYQLEACGGARCVDASTVCDQVCGSPQCAIAESFPMQVMCESSGPAPVEPPDAEADPCTEAHDAVQRELQELTSCEQDAQCGQVLKGTSCGCTRDVVARLDADLTTLQRSQTRLDELGCGGGLVSTCDCPPADGYRCAEGHCAWNYVDAGQDAGQGAGQ